MADPTPAGPGVSATGATPITGPRRRREPPKQPAEKPTGWDAIDGIDDSLRQQRAAALTNEEDMMIAYRHCFETPAGQVVLQDLERWLLRVSSWNPNEDFYKAAAQGFYREGQNSMVMYIREQINRAYKLGE